MSIETKHSTNPEPRYSVWRDLADMLVAIVAVLFVLASWLYALPMIAVLAGGQ